MVDMAFHGQDPDAPETALFFDTLLEESLDTREQEDPSPVPGAEYEMIVAEGYSGGTVSVCFVHNISIAHIEHMFNQNV